MKITPREYYICDYCGIRSESLNFKYLDNSGLNNRCYDMCSDKCLEKHISFLSDLYATKPSNFEDHVRCWIKER